MFDHSQRITAGFGRNLASLEHPGISLFCVTMDKQDPSEAQTRKPPLEERSGLSLSIDLTYLVRNEVTNP